MPHLRCLNGSFDGLLLPARATSALVAEVAVHVLCCPAHRLSASSAPAVALCLTTYGDSHRRGAALSRARAVSAVRP